MAVLGMLAKRFPRLDEDERLALYHDAWARLLAKRQRGEKIHSLRAYLTATTGAEALNVLSRGRVPTPVGPDDPRLAGLSDEAPGVEEQVVVRDQARIARGLLDTLDERQRDVLKLRWDLQLSGPEVQAALGLSRRQYRRLAEEGAAALADRVEELESGQWSRRTRSLLVACLIEVTRDGERRVGIASRRQRAEAQRLLDSDPHVAALYAEVRRSARGAAALLPLPALAFPSTARGPLERLAELGAALRDQLESAGQAVRHQATSAYLRAADPALLSGGPRPGAALVAVAGALAVGGGAYGAYEASSSTASSSSGAASQPAVTPIERDATAARPSGRSVDTPAAPRRPKPTSRSPQPKPSPTPPRPDLATQPQATPPPPADASPTPTQSPPNPQPTSPSTEFGFEN